MEALRSAPMASSQEIVREGGFVLEGRARADISGVSMRSLSRYTRPGRRSEGRTGVCVPSHGRLVHGRLATGGSYTAERDREWGRNGMGTEFELAARLAINKQDERT